MSASSAPPTQGSKRRDLALGLVTLLLSCLAGLFIAEVFLRVAFPQESMSPRWDFSPRYCNLPFPQVRMIHERPGRWRFVYSTNAHSGRGEGAALSRRSSTPSIVVLGDSYSFGIGVNDGEEYAAVLEQALGGSAKVVNLGVPGWGLTQQLRRFYEFGALYQPRVVILQFSANDPEDDLACPVTVLRNGRLRFRDSDEGIFRIKQFLSRSIIQKSQVYNLFRDSIYRLLAARVIAENRQTHRPADTPSEAPLDQRVYAGLLRWFAADLRRRGIQLIFLTVNHQVSGFPFIDSTVRQLAASGDLDFVDAADLLKGISNYTSPEGHWGRPAHRVIGMSLAEMVQGGLRASSPATP